MATVAEIQAVLDATGKGPTIARGPISCVDGLTSSWYVFGGVGVRVPTGEGRWVDTTDADSAATQGAAIITGLN